MNQDIYELHWTRLRTPLFIELTTHSGRPLEKHYIFFSRSGFTEPAQVAAKAVGALLVDLAEFDRVLAQALR